MSEPAESLETRKDAFFWAAIIAICVVTVFLLAPFFVEYDLSFVHPHRFENHLPLLVIDTLWPQWSDIVRPFQEFAAGEYRARFLTYAVILLDLKLRLAFYAVGVLPPAFSVSWILQGLGIYLVYRVATNFCGDWTAALLSALVYVSSVGFLSGLTMQFTPGKPLSGVIFAVVLLIMQRIVHDLPAGALLHRTRGMAKYWLWLLIFLGLLIDEVLIFLVVLVPVFFPECFLRRPSGSKDVADMVRATAFFFVPVLAFLIFALVVTPVITRHFYGYSFDYLSTTLGYGAGASGAKSLIEGPYGGFSSATLVANFFTLVGLSLVPWQISPLISNPGAGGVLTSQAITWQELAIVLPVLIAVGWLAVRAEGQRGRYFRRTIVAAVLFVLFQSLLNGRHVPYVSGYYYGSAFSVFIALLAAFTLAELMRFGTSLRFASVALAVAVVLVQIDNFYPLNRSWLFIHNERMARSTHQKEMPLVAEPRPVTAAELSAIWRAWKAGTLDSYLRAHPISAGAIFLVAELRWLDHVRKNSG